VPASWFSFAPFTSKTATGAKQLHNLLWAYCVNRSGGPEGASNNVLVFNPGKNYFDIVAIDDYKSSSSTEPQNIQAAYDEIKSIGKPIALGQFDWLDLVNVDSVYPRFSYFMAWDGTPPSHNRSSKTKMAPHYSIGRVS
jgi:hypothetical protein